jgi:hypothetical protein
MRTNYRPWLVAYCIFKVFIMGVGAHTVGDACQILLASNECYLQMVGRYRPEALNRYDLYLNLDYQVLWA